MNLVKLCEAPHIIIYFDSWNNWLYLEWYGVLTLPTVQHACREIARCYVAHSYPRVLNSNAQVTHIDWDVPAWLASSFLPALKLAGVEQLAWVHGTTVRGRDMVYETISRLGDLAITLFADIEDAVAWLQHTRPEYATGAVMLPRQLIPTEQLTQAIESFTKRLGVPQPEPAG